jgi:hypothetical protein
MSVIRSQAAGTMNRVSRVAVASPVTKVEAMLPQICE